MRRSYGPLQVQPISSTLIATNVLMFTYQVVNTVQWIAMRYPQHWPRQALAVLWDALLGSTSPGPLTRDFFYTTVWAQRQPHRYLTAGFLHGGIIHLLLNMESLRRLPTWLETGLGGGVYLTTFLASVVAGNVGHTFLAADGITANAACLGASGGICGLYGLLFVSLSRMGSQRAASQVLWGMGRVILYGLLLTNVSNASHIAGFGAGIAMGLLLAPTYRKSYSARRKNSLEVDVHSRDYRTAMGFGMEPSTRGGLVPLSLVWLSAAVCVLVMPRLRSAPQLVLRGLLKPGSLTSFWL
jgi:membrane associated rhomboid family serine protease